VVTRRNHVDWISLGLALFLAAYGLATYSISLLIEMAVGTLCVVAGLTTSAKLLERAKNPVGAISPTTKWFASFSQGLLILVVSILATVGTIEAQRVSPYSAGLAATSGYSCLARIFHYVVVAAVVMRSVLGDDLVGLCAAVALTSLFYAPTFSTAEAGLPFGSQAALAVSFLAHHCLWRGMKRYRSMLAFIVVALVASVFSQSPGESVGFLTRLVAAGVFAASVPVCVRSRRQWLFLALAVSAYGVAVPALLSAVKMAEVGWHFGLKGLLDYRIGMTELGRANLIARSLVTGMPLLAAQAGAAKKTGAAVLWSLLAIGIAVLIPCKSWAGWLGLGLAVALVLLCKALLPWHSGQPLCQTRGGRITAIITCMALALLVSALWRAAPAVNVMSFNGRLFQFAATTREIAHYPVLGAGPGHHFSKSMFTSGLGWTVDSATTLDNPLLPNAHLRRAATLHSHNLLLEIGAGTGLSGILAFSWFVVALMRGALRTLKVAQGECRGLILGGLAGISASLGWGSIDVMMISAPFLTFPTWALVGLLWAAPKCFGLEVCLQGSRRNCSESQAKESSRWRLADFRVPPRVVNRGIVAAWVLAVLAALLGNLGYREGYREYQRQDWPVAAERLGSALSYWPVSAKYWQLYGEALTNLGQYEEASRTYHVALRLKRGFSPYHAQLGWLAWLRDDLDDAISHFQSAVEMDPREAWREGLHADLGIAYAASGQIEAAIPLFAETIKLNPMMAQADYWMNAVGTEGQYEVVLDPVYVQATGVSPELEPRILAHLGRADYTPRLFARDSAMPSPVSLAHVLDDIRSECDAARTKGSREAPALLATVATAAHVSGLQRRAQAEYLAFQEMYPDSAFGYRELGRLYLEQGRTDEALQEARRAVDVSPGDPGAWRLLTEVHLRRGSVRDAREAWGVLEQLAPLEADTYLLAASISEVGRDSAGQIDALRKAVYIDDQVSSRLELADLLARQGMLVEAREQCTLAGRGLSKRWARPLDGEWREVAACQTGAGSGSDGDVDWLDLAAGDRFLGDLLEGHAHMVMGRPEEAAVAYDRAAQLRRDSGAPKYFTGQAMEALGRTGQAEAAYIDAFARAPTEAQPLLSLGRLQWAAGRREEALESLGTAVTAAPGWGDAHTALGNLLRAGGDHDAAAEQFRLAWELDGDVCDGVLFDFAAHIAEAEVVSPGQEYVLNDYFTVNGDRRRVLYEHPDSRVSFDINLPENAYLEFSTALSPASWDQPGDGVVFSILVDDGSGSTVLYEVYVDPKSRLADRRWRPARMDLAAYAGSPVRLEFVTAGGPADDTSFDWAGWGRPRLVDY
jgi:tetratricopeptide (TPR) repeat protein